MALNARIWQRVEVEDAQGNAHAIGTSLGDAPVVVTTTGNEIHDQTHTLATGVIEVVLNTDTFIGGFSVIAIQADQTVELELTIDDDADAGESYQVITLTKNVLFVLGQDDGDASDGSAHLFTGTADVIETVTIKNIHTADANIRVLALGS